MKTCANIEFKRIANNDKVLALYWYNSSGKNRYIIDIDLYSTIRHRSWLVYRDKLTTNNITIESFIMCGVAPLGRDKFINFRDGDSNNLCRENLEIIFKNTYTEVNNITYLTIISSLKHINTPITVIIDTLLVPQIKTYLWHIIGGYAQATIPKVQIKLCLHRFVISLTTELIAGLEIDHINNNKLDNRLINLRQVTGSTNQRNRRYFKQSKNHVIGVTKINEKWRATAPALGNSKKRRYAYFKISEYGNDVAYQLAVNKRREWEKEGNILTTFK